MSWVTCESIHGERLSFERNDVVMIMERQTNPPEYVLFIANCTYPCYVSHEEAVRIKALLEWA